jgi:hypothetical protein
MQLVRVIVTVHATRKQVEYTDIANVIEGAAARRTTDYFVE